MKKLIVLAAVAIMAVCSQAASFKWAASGVKDGSDNLLSGTAVLYAMIDGDWKVMDTQSMSSGTITASVFSDEAFSTGVTYQFKYEMTNADGTFASVTKSSKAQATATPTINFGAGGTWTGGGSGVPEPTSGLMLLVGAGMLALRRKRA